MYTVTDPNIESDDNLSVFTQLLYDRSRTSAFDLLKLLVALATGGVAGYFAQKLNPSICGRALDRADGPRLDGSRSVNWSFRMGSRGAVLRTLGAKSPEGKSKSKGPLWSSRRTANRARRFFFFAAVILFVLGLFISGLFAYVRSSRMPAEAPAAKPYPNRAAENDAARALSIASASNCSR